MELCGEVGRFIESRPRPDEFRALLSRATRAASSHLTDRGLVAANSLEDHHFPVTACRLTLNRYPGESSEFLLTDRDLGDICDFSNTALLPISSISWRDREWLSMALDRLGQCPYQVRANIIEDVRFAIGKEHPTSITLFSKVLGDFFALSRNLPKLRSIVS